MKNLTKLLVVLIIIISLLVPSTNVYANNDITIRINGEYIDFGVSPEIVNGRALVPFRALFEYLGAYYINWDQDRKEVSSYINGKDLRLKQNSKDVYVNYNRMELDTSVLIKNGVTFVPIRFVAETTGSDVKWDNASRTINITTNQSNITMENITTGVILRLRQPIAELENLMGKPDRIELSGKKYKLYIYNSKTNLEDYLQVGVNDKEIVAFKTNASNWVFDKDIKVGIPQKHVQTKYNINNLSFNISGGESINLYIDKHSSNTISTIVVEDRYYFDQRENKTEELARDFERQAFDLNNVYRIRCNLQPLMWSEEMETIAREHSHDMGTNNYFSHISLTGEKPQDRAKKQFGIRYGVGENISFNYSGPIEAMNGLYNSEGHRNNILRYDYKYLGIGVNFDNKSSMYLTQNFLSSYD